MTKLFVGNFAFEEFHLRGASLPATIRRLEAELACVWLAVADNGDEILCPEPIAEVYWDRMRQIGCAAVRPLLPHELHLSQADEIVPWAWTFSTRELAGQRGVAVNAPPQEVVNRLNSREFSVELVGELKCRLPGEEIVRALGELEDTLARTCAFDQGWVLKANFSQSGRDQLRGVGFPLSAEQRAWAARILKRDGAIAVEPWLNRVAEHGLQWNIPPVGPPELIGVTELLTDERGGYCGTRVGHQPEFLESLSRIQEVQQQAVLKIQGAGYFGLVGIDAMTYRTSSGVAVRAIQDINARWTMGRLALEWARRLSTGTAEGGGVAFRSGVWLHQKQAPQEECLELSPREIDGRLVQHRTWWIEVPCWSSRLSASPRSD